MVFSVQMISLGVIAELLIRLSTPRDVGDLVVEDVSERPATKVVAE